MSPDREMTREQIQELRKRLQGHYWPEEQNRYKMIDALCDLALRALDAGPQDSKPVDARPGDIDEVVGASEPVKGRPSPVSEVEALIQEIDREEVPPAKNCVYDAPQFERLADKALDLARRLDEALQEAGRHARAYNEQFDRTEAAEAALRVSDGLLREALDWWENALKVFRAIVPGDLQEKVEEQTKRIAEIRLHLDSQAGKEHG